MSGIIYFFVGAQVAEHKERALHTLRQNPQAVAVLGSPVEIGWFTGSGFKTRPGISCANLMIPVSGSKTSGSVFYQAVKREAGWVISEETLTVGAEDIVIVRNLDEMRYCR